MTSDQKTFAHHAPHPEALEKVRRLRAAFAKLSEELGAVCPPSRELSVAKTHLETTAMWAIKALVVNDSRSVPEEFINTDDDEDPMGKWGATGM